MRSMNAPAFSDVISLLYNSDPWPDTQFRTGAGRADVEWQGVWLAFLQGLRTALQCGQHIRGLLPLIFPICRRAYRLPMVAWKFVVGRRSCPNIVGRIAVKRRCAASIDFEEVLFQSSQSGAQTHPAMIGPSEYGSGIGTGETFCEFHTNSPASFAEGGNPRRRHVEIQAALLVSERHRGNAIAESGQPGLCVVRPVLHRAQDGTEEAF